MAEKTIVVCDVCGRPATETVTIKVARGNFVKDLCDTHVNELTAGGRRPRPGRPRKLAGEATAARRRGSPGKTANRKSRAKTAAGRKPPGRKPPGRKRSTKATGTRRKTGTRKRHGSSAGSANT